MKSYTQTITEILNAHDIICSHDGQTGLACVLYRGCFGEVYSMYACLDGESISNFSLYRMAVPRDQQPRVGRYLNRLNKPSSPLYFYIDGDTGCIAFNHEYRLSGVAEDDMAGLPGFCMETHRICVSYQIVLHGILQKCGIRNPAC